MLRLNDQILQAGDPTRVYLQGRDHIIHVLSILLDNHAPSDIEYLICGLALVADPVNGLVNLLGLLLLVHLPCLLEGVFDLLMRKHVSQLTQMYNSLLLTHQSYLRLVQLETVDLLIDLVFDLLRLFLLNLTAFE